MRPNAIAPVPAPRRRAGFEDPILFEAPLVHFIETLRRDGTGELPDRPRGAREAAHWSLPSGYPSSADVPRADNITAMSDPGCGGASAVTFT